MASLSVKVEWENKNDIFPSELYFSTLSKYGVSMSQDRYDAFLVALLYPAIRNFEKRIYIKGAISAKLYDNIKRIVEVLYFTLSEQPEYNGKHIEVEVESTVNNKLGDRLAGTGFSGGVDSLYAMYEYHHKCKVPEYKVGTLFFFNVGSHGDDVFGKEEAEARFWRRFEEMSEFANMANLPLIPLNSNVSSFHIWGHGRTELLTGASGALIFQPICSRYYWASSGWTYGQIYRNYKEEFGKYMAFLDPILLPLLSTEQMELVSQGLDCSRIEKVYHISNYELAVKSLNVCDYPNSKKNCGKCAKCRRTLMNLEVIGKLEEFRDVFEDVDTYKKSFRRKCYIARQLVRRKYDAFSEDACAKAKAFGFSFWQNTTIVAYIFEYIRFHLKKFKIVNRLYRLKNKNIYKNH